MTRRNGTPEDASPIANTIPNRPADSAATVRPEPIDDSGAPQLTPTAPSRPSTAPSVSLRPGPPRDDESWVDAQDTLKVPIRPPIAEPPVSVSTRPSEPPLAETIKSAITGVGDRPSVAPEYLSLESLDDPSESTRPGIYRAGAEEGATNIPHVAIGETLQLPRYARRGDTLLINGITPHGRRLTFEQREDRQGWYVVAAGRRRRPTQRELGLVVNTITQELEAAIIPERRAEVRSAYRLAVASDQPGMHAPGLEAYRDVLLDEASAFSQGLTERLTIASIEYQAFKRFAIRHGHRIGAAFVQALGERLSDLFGDEKKVHIFHKTGKAFRMIAVDRSATEVEALMERVTSDDTKEWLVTRVWGDDSRTHPEEVHFHIGISTAYPSERDADYRALAQRLSDDVYRAGKLGQLAGHTSLVLAKADYRTTLYRWNISSEDELNDLAGSMDDGPADVMAEMSDYLHELVQADLEGMAVAGDVNALLYCATAREGFWQGTTAMRIAGGRLVRSFLDGEQLAPDEHSYVGGFDLGDEFYGMVIENDQLFFARGDINSAGATRVRAGLDCVQHAVGWRREDGGGIVGRFLDALVPTSEADAVQRIRDAAQASYEENAADQRLLVNDAVDISGFLHVADGRPITAEEIVQGAVLSLVLPGEENRRVEVLTRRSGFVLRLAIDGVELPAAVGDTKGRPQLKLRVRNTVASAAIAIVQVSRSELIDVINEVREENMLSDDQRLDVVGFLRHISDILLEYQVKVPSKILMALGEPYDSARFVGTFPLEEVRELHPGLFYEAVHHDLMNEAGPPGLDKELEQLIGHTMLTSLRPMRPAKPSSDKPTAR